MVALVEAGEFDNEILPSRHENAEDQSLFNEILLSGARNPTKLTPPLQFIPVTPKNLFELRSLNATLFPMSYQDKYYKEVLAPDSLARIVSWNGRVVATFSCRIQAFYDREKPRLECYIMTFGVLAPFRGMRIGTLMLQSIIAYYQYKPEIKRITLHVHVINEIALHFYQTHGFSSLQMVSNYYKRLQPTTAHLLGLYLQS